MTEFTYTARDGSGAVVTGTVEAASTNEAAALLRQRGLWPTGLRERRSTTARSGLIPNIGSRIPSRELALIYRELATMLGAGVSVTRAVAILRDTAGSGSARRALADVAAAVERGKPLSEGMAPHERQFGKMEVAMVRAGEASGRVETMLLRAADHLEFEHQLRQKVVKMMVYPGIMLAAALVVPAVPSFILQGSQAAVHGYVLPKLLFLVRLLAVLLLLRFLALGGRGGLMLDRFKLAIPVFGTVLRKLAVARFARGLADLYGAGVAPASAMEMAADACGNLALGAQLRGGAALLRQGRSVADALQATGAVPSLVTHMAAVGQEGGSTDAALAKVAQYLRDDAVTTIDASMPVLQMLLWAVVAGYMVLQILSLLGGYVGIITKSLETQ